MGMMLAAWDTANETERAEVCYREYVSAKDCDAWVADQLARKAARKAEEAKRTAAREADEAERRAARDADEEKRRQERNSTSSHRMFLAATHPGASAAFSTGIMFAFAAGVSIVMFVRSLYSRRVALP